eukprot:355658-Chlamydomonas_euryale.AAC.2
MLHTQLARQCGRAPPVAGLAAPCAWSVLYGPLCAPSPSACQTRNPRQTRADDTMRLSLAPSAPSALVGRGGSRRCCAPPPTSAETLSPANRRGAFATVSAAPSALSPTAAGAQRGRGTCVVARAQQAQQRPPPRPTPSGRITPGGVGGPPRPDRPYQQGGYQSGQYQQPGGGPYSQQPYEPYGPQTQGGGQSGPPSGPPEGGDKSDGKKDFLNGYAKALIAGAFVCGLGVGVSERARMRLRPDVARA